MDNFFHFLEKNRNLNIKSIDFANKITYNEYNSSGYLISTIIKNVSRNPICEYKWIGEKM